MVAVSPNAAARRSWGSFVARERRGGSEDPWLCAPSFRWVCLCRESNSAPVESAVNSGICVRFSRPNVARGISAEYVSSQPRRLAERRSGGCLNPVATNATARRSNIPWPRRARRPVALLQLHRRGMSSRESCLVLYLLPCSPDAKNSLEHRCRCRATRCHESERSFCADQLCH